MNFFNRLPELTFSSDISLFQIYTYWLIWLLDNLFYSENYEGYEYGLIKQFVWPFLVLVKKLNGIKAFDLISTNAVWVSLSFGIFIGSLFILFGCSIENWKMIQTLHSWKLVLAFTMFLRQQIELSGKVRHIHSSDYKSAFPYNNRK